jgi:DNA-binding transcriptional MerR regulator
LTSCTQRQLRYWDQVGLVKPSVQGTGGRPGVPRLYSFRDLVALKVVRSLLDGGMSLQRVRRSWDFLNRRAGLDQHLSEVKLVTDGVSIFRITRKQREVLDALREGQMAFFVAIDEIARSVDAGVTQFREDRDRFIRALQDARRDVATG